MCPAHEITVFEKEIPHLLLRRLMSQLDAADTFEQVVAKTEMGDVAGNDDVVPAANLVAHPADVERRKYLRSVFRRRLQALCHEAIHLLQKRLAHFLEGFVTFADTSIIHDHLEFHALLPQSDFFIPERPCSGWRAKVLEEFLLLRHQGGIDAAMQVVDLAEELPDFGLCRLPGQIPVVDPHHQML